MIDDKIIELINEKTDIVSLVSEFVSLEKVGKNFRGLCPFHNEKTPSFSVSPEKNIAKCMGCGEGGRAITFYQKIKNLSFNDAVSDLAERLGITLEIKKDRPANPNTEYYKILKDASEFFAFVLNNSEQGKRALEYLSAREISAETISHFQIGVAPKKNDALYNYLKDKSYKVSDLINLGLVKQREDGTYYDVFTDRLMFTITNSNGDVVGFSGRALEKSETIKYVNSSENAVFKKGTLLYNYFESIGEIRKNKQVILVEGFFDAISPYQIGVKNCVASMGTALTKEQSKLIKKVTDRVLISYDGDNAGQKATIAAIEKLTNEKLLVEVLRIPEGLDPDEFIKQYGPEKFESLLGEYVMDSYRFGYEYYKKGKDFKNANNVKEFKEQIELFLRNADTTVKDLYARIIGDELGIKISSSGVYTRSVEEPRKIAVKKKDIVKKYEIVERRVVVAILKNNSLVSYCNGKIQPYTDTLSESVTKILGYLYQLNGNEEITLNLLLEKFASTPVAEFILKDIMEDELYKDTKAVFDESEINKYVVLLKKRNLELELEELRDAIGLELNQTKRIKLANECDFIRRKINGLK